MEKRNLAEDKCLNPECIYNIPYIKPHKHIRTPYGYYVRFIVDKPKKKVHNDYDKLTEY